MTFRKGTKRGLSAFFSLKPTCSVANPPDQHKTYLALPLSSVSRDNNSIYPPFPDGHTSGLSQTYSDKHVFFLSFNRVIVVTMFHSYSVRSPAFEESDVYCMILRANAATISTKSGAPVSLQQFIQLLMGLNTAQSLSLSGSQKPWAEGFKSVEIASLGRVVVGLAGHTAIITAYSSITGD